MNHQRVLAGVGVHLYSQAITVVTQLAGVPLMLAVLGVERYGVWLVIVAVPTYLALADFGFFAAAANQALIARTRGDEATVRRLFDTCTAFAAAVVAGFALLAVAIAAVPWPSDPELPKVLAVLVAATGLMVAAGVADVYYRSALKYPLVTFYLSSARLVEWGTSMAFLAVGRSMLAAAVGMLAGRLVVIAWLLWRRRRDLPDLRLSFAQATGAQTRELVRTGWPFLLFPLSLTLGIQGAVMVCGAVLGPVAVAALSVMRVLSRLLVQLCTITSRSLAPELSVLFAQERIDEVWRQTWSYFWKTFGVSLAGAVLLLLVGRQVIVLWTGGQVAVTPDVWAVVVVTALLNAQWQVLSAPLLATNSHVTLGLVCLGAAAAGLGLGWMLATPYGLPGLAAGALLAEAVTVAVVLVLFRRWRARWRSAGSTVS